MPPCAPLALLLFAATPTPATTPAAASPTAAPAPAKPSRPAPSGPVDLDQQVRTLFRLVACAGDAPLPPGWKPAMLDKHCGGLKVLRERWNKRFVEKAGPFVAKLRPTNLPRDVLYPFGGGDLFTALVLFPDATRITTLSLEPAGDPRRAASAPPEVMLPALDELRDDLRRLFAVMHSRTDNLRALGAGGVLPTQLAFALVALADAGGEPTGLRTFRVEPDGKPRYLGPDELRSARPDAFAHLELTWRPRGGGAERTYVHLAANLSDESLAKDPSVLRLLESRGRLAAMTKAASYLLWSPRFSSIRKILIDRADWMISDSTGILPRDAKAAGLEQEVWGSFAGPIEEVSVRAKDRDEAVAFWRATPTRPLPFAFGYPDLNKKAHLLVTRRPGVGSGAMPTNQRP